MARLASSRGLLPYALAGLALAGAATAYAASTSFWLVSTQADFLKGEVEQLSVDSDGRVMLGPAVDTLHETGTPAVWRLAVDADGAVWAGTGNEGKVIKVDRGGKASVVYDATELEIHALATAAGGTVYAGSSPDGRVYKIGRDGKTAPFYDPEDKYIWTLLAGPDGTIYAGTGEKGRVYKIGADGKGSQLYDAGTTHVTALAWDGRGALLVGTSTPGRVIRVDPATGRGFVLLESAYKEIRAIRVSTAGSIYATAVGASAAPAGGEKPTPAETTTTTSPVANVSTEVTITAIGDMAVVTPSSGSGGETRSSGTKKGGIYRIAPDGDWDEIWSSSEDSPYDVLIEPNGSLLVATGDKGKIFRISGDPAVSTLVTRAVSQQATSFAQDGQGRLHYATSNPGRILRFNSEQAERGTYLSDVKDTSTVSTWGGIRWRAVTPAGTSVELFTRSGNTKTPDGSWSDWSKAYKNASGEPVASPKARYLQWRAVLSGSGKTTPILTSVTAAYLPRNARPTVESITVHPPGVVFQRPFPTGDPELAGFESGTSDGRPSTSSSSTGVTLGAGSGPALGRRTFQKSLQTFVWRAEDGDEDKLQYDVWYRSEGETDWKLLKRGLWDGIYTWDTTSAPDGTYVLKVTASDAPSNAPDSALTAERESATFEIDNTPPTIDVVPAAGAAAGKAAFTVRDSHSPIQRVEYSTSAGGWKLLYPVDGLLDAREERFEIVREATSTEPIVLRATDTLGNVATAVVPAGAPKPAAAGNR